MGEKHQILALKTSVAEATDINNQNQRLAEYTITFIHRPRSNHTSQQKLPQIKVWSNQIRVLVHPAVGQTGRQVRQSKCKVPARNEWITCGHNDCIDCWFPPALASLSYTIIIFVIDNISISTSTAS